MDRIALARRAALAGWLGLTTLFPLWYGWYAPPPGVLGPILIAIALLPLMLVGPGLWRGRPRSYHLGGILALLYFMHALGELFANPAGRRFALAELLLSLSLYLGGLLYVRWSRGR